MSMRPPENEEKFYTIKLWKGMEYTVTALDPKTAIQKAVDGHVIGGRETKDMIDDVRVIQDGKEVFRDSPYRNFREWLDAQIAGLETEPEAQDYAPDVARLDAFRDVRNKLNEFLDAPSIWQDTPQDK